MLRRQKEKSVTIEGDYCTNSLPQNLVCKKEKLGISLVFLKRNCSSSEVGRRKLYRKKKKAR